MHEGEDGETRSMVVATGRWATSLKGWSMLVGFIGHCKVARTACCNCGRRRRLCSGREDVLGS